jgi:hypothetical protein
VVSDAIAEVMAINSQIPSGDGVGGRLRFLFRAGDLMITDGRNTSPLVVVCVFMFLLV